MHWLIVRPMGDLVPRSGVRHSRHAGRRVPGTFEFEYLTRTAIAGQGRARWAPRCRYGFSWAPLREITQIAFVTAYAVDHGGRGGDKEKRGLEDRTPLRMDTELAGTR